MIDAPNRDQERDETSGITMFSSPTIAKGNSKTGERRSASREEIQRFVALVLFGEDNWGKLINMSESGMALEFARPPSLRERLSFTFKAMSCLPMPAAGGVLGE